MNNYSMNDIEVGLKHSFERIITNEMLDLFQKITLDNNPLHTDKSYAKSRGFDDKVAYGLLTGSFLSTLAGVYLPGKRSLIHKVAIKFHKPVYVDDCLSIHGEVSEKDDRFQCIKLKVKVVNQDSIKVASGSLQVGVLSN